MLDLLTENKWLLGGLVAASGILFVLTLLLLPVIIVRLPADYFTDRKRHRSRWREKHPLVGVLVTVLRNLLGFIFVMFGLVMLVTPGQGVLSILIGLTMMNYPGKYRFERWLVSRKHVWRAVGWIRKRAGVLPLEEVRNSSV